MNSDGPSSKSVSVTVIIAARNESANLPSCLESLSPAERIVLVDSGSTDETADIARNFGADVIQFEYQGGYPRKRQWAMDTLEIATDWVMLIDADECVPPVLWLEIANKLESDTDAFVIKKAFHFLGRRLVFGGFSHSAVLLFRKGKARFEELALEDMDDGFDMEVHERLHVGGRVGRMKSPVLHKDVKSVDHYIARHRGYARWEARVRYNYIRTGSWGKGMDGDLFGDVQQRRRFLKGIAVRMPFEPICWFVYHYVIMLGFLEGKAGFVASRIRMQYISWVRKCIKEIKLQNAS